MWKAGGPVFPPKRELVAGRTSYRKTNAMQYKMQIRNCRLRRLLIGNEVEGQQHESKGIDVFLADDSHRGINAMA